MPSCISSTGSGAGGGRVETVVPEGWVLRTSGNASASSRSSETSKGVGAAGAAGNGAMPSAVERSAAIEGPVTAEGAGGCGDGRA